MKKLSKKGTDKIISVYWFVILFIVAAAIVYMAAVFYGEPYDVREVEASIMINKIADYISQGGRLTAGALDKEKFNKENILSKCHLTFSVEDFKNWKKQEQFYVEISFEKFEGSSARDPIETGNPNLKEYCDKKGKNLPVCVERSFYVLGNDIPYVIKIKSIVGKTEKNVK